MLYLDTSAFLKLYVREEGSEAVQALVSGQPDPLPIPEFLQIESFDSRQNQLAEIAGLTLARANP